MKKSQPQQFGQGRGKSLGALSAQHDRMVKMGKAPKVTAVPIAVRQHHKPILDQREEEKNAAGQIGFQNMRGPGKKIGLANLKSEEKWRCATCKQANDNSLDACIRCKDPKKVLVEKMPAAKRNTTVPSKAAPMKFTNQGIKTKEPAPTKARPTQAQAAAASKQKAFVPQPPGQMMTFKDLQNANTSDKTQGRQARVNKEPMLK